MDLDIVQTTLPGALPSDLLLEGIEENLRTDKADYPRCASKPYHRTHHAAWMASIIGEILMLMLQGLDKEEQLELVRKRF